MFAKPGFVSNRTGGSAVPGLDIPLVHEDPSQRIQGGLPGQHYHLSKELYQWLISDSQNQFYAEPIMTLGGEIITSLTGDIAMTFVNLPPVPVFDMVTGDNPVPVPTINNDFDPYWNSVVAQSKCIILDPVENGLVNEDQYNAAIDIAGAGIGIIEDSPFFRIFDHGALEIADKSDITPPFLMVTPSKNSGPFELSGEYTAEGWLFMEIGGADKLWIMCVGNKQPLSSQYGMIFDGTSKKLFHMKGSLYDIALPPEETILTTWDWTILNGVGQAFHYCFEKSRDLWMRFYIDGHFLGKFYEPHNQSWLNITAEGYGPVRITWGARRYAVDDGNFTPPSRDFPVGVA